MDVFLEGLFTMILNLSILSISKF